MFFCLSSLLSLSSRPGLLRPPSGPGVPPVRHRGGHLLHLHRRLAQELPIRRLPVPSGPLRPPCPPAAMLQQPEPGRLPGPRRASPSQLAVPQRVHRHQLLPHPARPQPRQRLRGLQETQHAAERGHAVVRGAGRLATGAEPSPASDEAGGAEPAQLRRVEHRGERLRELRGGHVLSFWFRGCDLLRQFASFYFFFFCVLLFRSKAALCRSTLFRLDPTPRHHHHSDGDESSMRTYSSDLCFFVGARRGG